MQCLYRQCIVHTCRSRLQLCECSLKVSSIMFLNLEASFTAFHSSLELYGWLTFNKIRVSTIFIVSASTSDDKCGVNGKLVSMGNEFEFQIPFRHQWPTFQSICMRMLYYPPLCFYFSTRHTHMDKVHGYCHLCC